MHKLIPKQINWKGLLLESTLFLAAYIVWAIFRSPDSPARLFIGSVAVLVPGATAVILLFQFLEQFPEQSRPAWRFLGFGLACWSSGNLVRSIYEGAGGIAVPVFSLADVLSFLAYPLFFLALILYPFENRYAPSRFRFLLDVTISAGVVATLVGLMLGRPDTAFSPASIAPLIYPIADFILLAILFNMLLANRQARRTLFLWGCGLFAFMVSDYIYSLLAPVNGFQSGGLESIGWMAGGLIFGWGAVFTAGVPVKQDLEERPPSDLGTRLQNILPFAFVLALDWLLLAEWRLNGHLSWLGAGASLFLTLALVVRMGVRAGEIELQQYWQLFSSMAEPVFICEKSGKIRLGNPALAHALGRQTAHEINGTPLSTIFEGQTLPVGLLERAAHETCSAEVILAQRQTACLLSLSPIFSEGRKMMIAGALHDLSDQKRQQAALQKGYTDLHELHTQLEDLNAKLEQKVEERTLTLTQAYQQMEEQNIRLQELDQLKSDFVSMVSHELRTPLASLYGGLELLLLPKNRSTADRSTLLLMKEEVERLKRFVENILNLSVIDAGQIQLSLAPVSLEAVLKSVCNKFGVNPAARQIEMRMPEDCPPVLADQVVLESIFNHLLDNALKYAPESPVVVEAIQIKNRVRLQVTDRGPGIPSGKRRLLFQRFQRLEASDAQSVYGYGLGLYLSWRMLRAMQSDLSFEAPPEGGARFYFLLKVAR
ncbi:MAG: ATP-binding protein [Anaerolineales bacterium]